jgi:hypothetical protein
MAYLSAMGINVFKYRSYWELAEIEEPKEISFESDFVLKQ